MYLYKFVHVPAIGLRDSVHRSFFFTVLLHKNTKGYK